MPPGASAAADAVACKYFPAGKYCPRYDELDGACAPNYNFAALRANLEDAVYARIGLAKDGRMGVGVGRMVSGCRFRKTATEYDRKLA
jgi:hypothetical protein